MSALFDCPILMLAGARYRWVIAANDTNRSCHPGRHVCRKGELMTKFFSILLAAAALAATPASAALDTANFSGTINELPDPNNTFGLAVGQSVTMSVIYDTSVFSEPGVFLNYWPGEAINFTVGSLVFTLADFTDVFGNGAPVLLFNTGFTELLYSGNNSNGYLYTGVNLINPAFSSGTFILSTDLDSENVFARGTLSADSTGAVPEPASWAMLIAGFGLTGAAMCRRSRTAAAIA